MVQTIRCSIQCVRVRDINDTGYDDYREAGLEVAAREIAMLSPNDLPAGPLSPG